MASETEVTVRGRLGHHPELQVTEGKKPWLRLRVATNRRIRTGDNWGDGPTSWYDVKLWGDFAQNVAESVRKGDPVIVQGPLQIEEYVGAGGVTLRTAVIHANAFGPDLRNLTARLTRVQRVTEGGEAGQPVGDAPARHLTAVDVSGMVEVEEPRDLDAEPEPADERELSEV